MFLFRQAGPAAKLDQENCTNEFLFGQYRYTRQPQSNKNKKSWTHPLQVSFFDKKHIGPTNQQNPFGRMPLLNYIKYLLHECIFLSTLNANCKVATNHCKKNKIKYCFSLNILYLLFLLTFGPIKGVGSGVPYGVGSARIVYMRQHQRISAVERALFGLYSDVWHQDSQMQIQDCQSMGVFFFLKSFYIFYIVALRLFDA